MGCPQNSSKKHLLPDDPKDSNTKKEGKLQEWISIASDEAAWE